MNATIKIFLIFALICGASFGAIIYKSCLPDRYKQGFMDGIQARIDYEKGVK